jgi:hypothetical protein
MVNHIKIASQVKKIADKKGTLKATESLLKKYNILPENVEIALKPNDAQKALVVTTEGDFGKDLKQIVRVPENIFEFPMEMIVNMLAHEMLHIRQKTGDELVTDKNEREFQAYFEGVFPKVFTDLPASPNWLKKQLANQAIRYYAQMGEGSTLQNKYAEDKLKLVVFLAEIT